ncbi:heterokaryon incompatibility protein-domain-containing protein [Hypoxylon sp. NC1633]|nr:heterokaryon incompatibility protein-domain-containing protein [Hypoxylon sp. NC1633]
MNQYQDEPLPTSEHIRLVTIQAGRFEDDILLSFDIVTFASDECPSYEALSYTWDSSGSRAVHIAVKDILRCLRYADKPRVMWIDALCINQNDEVEKGPQVARMGRIYRSAHRTSISVGKEENASTRALNIMLWIESKVTIDWVRFTVALRPECGEPSFRDIDIGVPLRPEDTEAIFHLLTRKGFERFWIRQEVLLAETTAEKPRTWTRFDDKLNNRLLSLREFLPEKDGAVVGSSDYTKDVEVIFRDIKEVIYGRSYWRGFVSSHFDEVYTISEDERVLRTPGASIITVEDLKDISTMDGHHPNEQVQETLSMLVTSDELDGRYVTGMSMLEAFARTSSRSVLDPTFEEAQEIIWNALKKQEQDQGPSKTLFGRTRDIYGVMRAMLGGRKLMRGSGGYIGTLPQPTHDGDEICVLLGCHTPMGLRRVKDDIFRIVGECYVLGISEGEVLLGPLPDGTRRLFASGPKSGVPSCFLNSRTGYQA